MELEVDIQAAKGLTVGHCGKQYHSGMAGVGFEPHYAVGYREVGAGRILVFHLPSDRETGGYGIEVLAVGCGQLGVDYYGRNVAEGLCVGGGEGLEMDCVLAAEVQCAKGDGRRLGDQCPVAVVDDDSCRVADCLVVERCNTVGHLDGGRGDGAGAQIDVVQVAVVRGVAGSEAEGYVLSGACVGRENGVVAGPAACVVDLYGVERCESLALVGVGHHADGQHPTVAIGYVAVGAEDVEGED